MTAAALIVCQPTLRLSPDVLRFMGSSSRSWTSITKNPSFSDMLSLQIGVEDCDLVSSAAREKSRAEVLGKD